jgi:hypothetical protein
MTGSGPVVKRRRFQNPAAMQRRMVRERALRELRSDIESYWLIYAAIRDAEVFNPRLYWRLGQFREKVREIFEDLIAAPELIDPRSIKVVPYDGKFAAFAGGKLLKAGFLTQPLAHFWLKRHLKANGQIVADPDSVIEWSDAQDQSRSVH